ncbi:hypothetical protein M378DRAFT_161661 [Amanita muscaria Koide BX008]|uniref:Uncharacterized protein n=1 Tax=Amanita muscaria (strain Koide BX008) TaxID=946122 RepID=A0A0C2WV97_AMAMK|nr:hypothetical protein M378DRAFT_161661 [Amanita muscaria Koide BX008]
MPGPSNKKKPKSRRKDTKNGNKSTSVQTRGPSPTPSESPSQQLYTPPPIQAQISEQSVYLPPYEKKADKRQPADDGILTPPRPFIYDPGTGPRVRDPRAFLSSAYFAEKPAMHVPLCAEFAQPEILEMLRTILPEETALILWYNKSRSTSRICPACQRLYRLGDNLPDLVSEEPLQISKHERRHEPPYLRGEQAISGLCSPICFILASFNYPGAIKQAWGRMVDDIDDQTWEMMNERCEGNQTSELGRALSMLVKMTRLHDLGLGQLCFGVIGDSE